MDTVKFLEQLAKNAHHQINIGGLINQLPEEIKNAFLMNNAESLKMKISDTDYFANESHVVQVQL